MAFKIEFNEIKLVILMLFGLPLITATNIDCNGKAFHCVNTTHFIICVDLGSGVSKTLDDFVIPCPPTTGCLESNKYECEYLPITPTVLPVFTSEVNSEVTENASTLAWEPISDTANGQKTNEVEHSEKYNTLNNSTSELVLPTDAEPTELETSLLSEDTIVDAEVDIQNIEVTTNTVEIISTATSQIMTTTESLQNISENGLTDPFGLTNTIVGDTTTSVYSDIISPESFNGLSTTVGIQETPFSYLSTENTININVDDYQTSASPGVEEISTTEENIITEIVEQDKNFTDVLTVPSTTSNVITTGAEETSTSSIVSDGTSVTMIPITTTTNILITSGIDAGLSTKIPDAEEPTSFVTEDISTSEQKLQADENVAAETVTAEINDSTMPTNITLEVEKKPLLVVKEISDETSFTVKPTTTTLQTLTTIAVDTGVPASSYVAEEVKRLPGSTETESVIILPTTATEEPVSALITEGQSKTSSDIFPNDEPAEYTTTAITLESEVLTSRRVVVTSTPSKDVVPSDSPITFTTDITPGSEVQENITDGNGNDLSFTLTASTATESYNAMIITETDASSSFGIASSSVATPERDGTSLPVTEITDGVTPVTTLETESIVDESIKNITTPAEIFSSTSSKPEITTSFTTVTDTEFSITKSLYVKSTKSDFSVTPESEFIEQINETSFTVYPTDQTSEIVSTSTSRTEELTIETSFIIDSNSNDKSSATTRAPEVSISTLRTEQISNDTIFIVQSNNETTETVSNVLTLEPVLSTSPYGTEGTLKNSSFTIVFNTSTEKINMEIVPDVPKPISLTDTKEKQNKTIFNGISSEISIDKTTENAINDLTLELEGPIPTTGKVEIASITNSNGISNDKTTETVIKDLTLESEVPTAPIDTEEKTKDTSLNAISNDKTLETVTNGLTLEPEEPILGTEEITNETSFTTVYYNETSETTYGLTPESKVPKSTSGTEKIGYETTAIITVSTDKTTEKITNGLTLAPKVLSSPSGTEEILNDTSFAVISNKATDTDTTGLTSETQLPVIDKLSDKSFTEIVATVLIPTTEIPTSVVNTEVNQIDKNNQGVVTDKNTNLISDGFEIVDSTLPAAESITTADPLLTIDLSPLIDSHTIVDFDEESINQFFPNNIKDNLTPKSTTNSFLAGIEPYTDIISTYDTISTNIITEEDSSATKAFKDQEFQTTKPFGDIIAIFTSNDQLPVTEKAIPVLTANEGDKRTTSNLLIPFEEDYIITAAGGKQQFIDSFDNKQVSEQGIGNTQVDTTNTGVSSIADSVLVTYAKESITPLKDLTSNLGTHTQITQNVNNNLVIDTSRVTNGATKVSNIVVSVQDNTIESELNGSDKDNLNQETLNKTIIKSGGNVSNSIEKVKINNIEIDTHNTDNPLKDLILNTNNAAQIFNETSKEQIRNTNVNFLDLRYLTSNNTNRDVTTKNSVSESFLKSVGTVPDANAIVANDNISSILDLNEGLKTTENTNVGKSPSYNQQSIITTPLSVDINDAGSLSNSYQNKIIPTQENQETTLFTVAHNTLESNSNGVINSNNVDGATIKPISPKYYRDKTEVTEHNIYSTQTALEDGSILSSANKIIQNTLLPSTGINEQKFKYVTVNNQDIYATANEMLLSQVTITPQQARSQFTIIETNDRFDSVTNKNAVDIININPTPNVISIATPQAIDDSSNLQSKTAESIVTSAKANSLTNTLDNEGKISDSKSDTANDVEKTKPTTVNQNVSKNPTIQGQTEPTSLIPARDKSVSTTPTDQTNDVGSTITSIPDSTNHITIETIPTQINYVKTSESATEADLTSTTLSNSDLTFSTIATKTIQKTTKSSQASSVTVDTTNASKPPFNCLRRRRGRYSDPDDCRKYYVCIGLVQPIIGICPKNTVFSNIHKQCTKNLSHCIRGNEFQCFSEGRFIDIYKNNIYYICVKDVVGTFYRFKLQCQNGFYLNKNSMKCEKNNIRNISESVDSNSKSESDKSSSNNKTKEEKEMKKFECEKEGKFVYPGNCRKYYECRKKKSSFKKKTRKCDSDELFHKEKMKCVDADSYECK